MYMRLGANESRASQRDHWIKVSKPLVKLPLAKELVELKTESIAESCEVSRSLNVVTHISRPMDPRMSRSGICWGNIDLS
jgi:hypothetical protein